MSSDRILPLLAAIVVGSSLSVSGAALQCVLGNPLAEPYMLGMVGGAALFAAVAVELGCSWALVPPFAFAGACFAIAAVTVTALLAARRDGGRVGGETVVLAGFVVGGFTGSLQMLVVSFAEPGAFTRISKWLFGDLGSVNPWTLAAASAAALVSFLAIYSRNRELNALVLGDDAAECVGVKPRRTLFTVLAATSLATAASVALAGAIGFIGLVVPHVVRRLAGGNHRALLPLSALVGAVALVGADSLARLLPFGVSAGCVCAVLGAPFFLHVLVTRPRR